ncbi:uncharacterized protein UHOD_11947 [Ustilago sp. UG-2017b]|nr:uncharacterized protein UHOD_11947 [Ustilago sp. UG-2017b]
MDLNPFQFRTPFDYCELASFCVQRDVDLLVMPMAWLLPKHQEPRVDSSPSLSTINYWAMRCLPFFNPQTASTQPSSSATAVGDAVVGDAAVGDAVVGDAAVGDAVVGDAAVGDAAVGDAVVGDAAVGDANPLSSKMRYLAATNRVGTEVKPTFASSSWVLQMKLFFTTQTFCLFPSRSQGTLIAMKLSGMFRIGFVATIVTALILLPSCIAFDNEEASTSTSQPSHPDKPWPPKKVTKYMGYLDFNTIERLPRSSSDQRNVPFFYSKTPRKLTTPLYSIDTPTATVEQALRDHKSVGIVDVSNDETRLIQIINDGHQSYLTQGLFPNVEPDPIQLFKLDPDLHRLRQLPLIAENGEPPMAGIRHLPYANGKPILSHGSEALGHMLYATRTEPYSFYYFKRGMEPILVVPHKNELIYNLDEAEKRKLRHIMGEYQTAKTKFGQTLASIIWGRPIKAGADPHGLRTSQLRTEQYPKFSRDAPRDEMVTALRRNGRFRVYGNEYDYVVKVTNPQVNGNEAFNISVDRIIHRSGFRWFF